jgi:hypothetical protein
MARFGLIGGSYTSQALTADCQRTMNWYPENIESGSGKTQAALYPTPGLKLFAALAGPTVRAMLEINGRLFAVSGGTLYELFANGTATAVGSVADDEKPASLVANAQQLLVSSGGNCYVYDLAAYLDSTGKAHEPGNFNPVGAGIFTGAVTQVEYVDGFFIALIPGLSTFFVSTVLDATQWATPGGANSAKISVYPDQVVGMKVDHREIAFFGRRRIVTYYDSGNLFPFDVVPSGYMETGAIAPFGIARADNSIFWLGGDERGAGMVWRNQGYTPQRVSNHAVENALAGYARIDDCVAYSYQDRGHTFVVLAFPTAQATWVFDMATNLWHERGYWNANGTFTAHRSQCHAYVFGKHLVGDLLSGNTYDMSANYFDDNSNPLRRVRRAPVVSTEDQWLFHSELQVSLESGLGPEPPLLDGAGIARAPQLLLRWSDDAAHTWSNTYPVSCGMAGQFRVRAIWRRLGRSRNRVYEISASDAIPWRIVDGYLTAAPGFQKVARLSKYFEQMT